VDHITEVFVPAVAVGVLSYGAGLPLLVGAVLAALIVATLVLRVERRRVAAETRATVMASVMDVQNNFLNNLVYFRTRAEADGSISPSDLAQMESAIRDAQASLIEIAEADLTETRDLGGISVLEWPKAKLAS
jgi:hypothetical protein